MDALQYFSNPNHVREHLEEFNASDPTNTFGKELAQALFRSHSYQHYEDKGNVLIDLGPGDGRLMSLLATSLKFKEAIAVDGSARMLELLRESARSRFRKIKLGTVHENLKNPLPIAARTATLVNCMGTSIYLKDLENLFSETERILKTNSLFSLSVSVHQGDRVLEVSGEEPYPNYFVHPEEYVSQLIRTFGFSLESEFLRNTKAGKGGIVQITKYLILKKGAPKK